MNKPGNRPYTEGMSFPPRSMVEIDDAAGARRTVLVRLNAMTFSERGMQDGATPRALHPVLGPRLLGTFWEHVSRNGLQGILDAAVGYLRKTGQHDVVADPVMLPKMIRALEQGGNPGDITEKRLKDALDGVRRDERAVRSAERLMTRYLDDLRRDVRPDAGKIMRAGKNDRVGETPGENLGDVNRLTP